MSFEDNNLDAMLQFLERNLFQHRHPTMNSFINACRYEIHDGFGKNFCQEPSFLCANDICKDIGLIGPRDCFVDGFRLFREEKSEAQDSKPLSSKWMRSQCLKEQGKIPIIQNRKSDIVPLVSTLLILQLSVYSIHH